MLYRDDVAADLVGPLVAFDGVLVWVDPISAEGDRTVLDAVLRVVAAAGTWVSAHPDTILKMGTKEVLYRTRTLGWGMDTRLYSSGEELRERLPTQLSTGQPRVLKQNRGNGGLGVWKVELIDAERQILRAQHAAPRDDAVEQVALDEFIARCEPFFSGGGKLVDQPFVERIADGMIRTYLVGRDVVGFARQQPASRAVDPAAPDPDRVLGLPSAKTMYDEDEPTLAGLRARVETEWVPDLCTLVGISEADLPVLWDADFLYGPRTESGEDSHLLCEINVSSVIPFPPHTPARVARAVREQLTIRTGHPR